MTRKKLTKDDVARLLSDPSGETRVETATKIAGDFNAGALSEAERNLAEEIFRVMVKDAEVRVREALARNLKECTQLPHDVALNLARDVDKVALPVLQFSEVLTDDDLIEIIHSQSPKKQVAIAKRKTVSENVSDALVDTGNEDAVTTLVSNDGAEISEKTFEKVVEGFGGSESVQDAMVHRAKLPVAISERLVTIVSEKFAADLIGRHDLPEDVITDLILQTRERAVISLSNTGSVDELQKLIWQLADNGRLTPSLVLRALCMGDMAFYESAVAELANISIINVRTLVHDGGEKGFRALYEKTGLPMAHFPAAVAAIEVARETEYDGGVKDRERYSRRMMERILTQYGDLGVELDSNDLEYLLAKMNEMPDEVIEGQ